MGSSRLCGIVVVSCSMGLFMDLHVFYDDFYFRMMNKTKINKREKCHFLKSKCKNERIKSN
jgi:hypothetical protein